MSKIILVRHGLAETSNPYGDDARKLTYNGVQLLNKCYPQYFAELCNEPIDLFASNTERTLQTANIISKIVGAPVSISSELTTRNFDAIINLIQMADKTTILVGHNPVIEKVASNLTQRLRGMLRGEALCLEKVNHNYKLLWRCVPK